MLVPCVDLKSVDSLTVEDRLKVSMVSPVNTIASSSTMTGTPQITRTSLQLYRDCMRLAKHIGGKSKKGQAIKELIRREFEKGRSETDPEKIEVLKANAVRGLSNYLVMANSSKDKSLRDAMKASSAADKATSNGPIQAEYREL